MVELKPHDAAVLSRLVQFSRLPIEKRKELLRDPDLSDDARKVGEAVLDKKKYSESPEQVRATVDYYREWQENNLRIGRRRRRVNRLG